MKLKCTNNGDFLPLKVGQFYDVVELLEHPEHGMVRELNGYWPKPGNPLYDIHPDEFFESPDGGLEIIHGGYEYIDDEFYGIIITDLKEIKKILTKQHEDEFWDNPKTSDAEADAEERRLYYVAVTRAKSSLYVIASASEKSMFMSNKPFIQLEKFEIS